YGAGSRLETLGILAPAVPGGVPPLPTPSTMHWDAKMNDKIQTSLLALGAALALSVAAPQIAAAADNPPVHGLVSARERDHMPVTSADGSKILILITPATKIEASSGAFGANKTDKTAADVLNGLPVKVEYTTNGTENDAVEINFKASDLKTAQQVE